MKDSANIDEKNPLNKYTEILNQFREGFDYSSLNDEQKNKFKDFAIALKRKEESSKEAGEAVPDDYFGDLSKKENQHKLNATISGSVPDLGKVCIVESLVDLSKGKSNPDQNFASCLLKESGIKQDDATKTIESIRRNPDKFLGEGDEFDRAKNFLYDGDWGKRIVSGAAQSIEVSDKSIDKEKLVQAYFVTKKSDLNQELLNGHDLAKIRIHIAKDLGVSPSVIDETFPKISQHFQKEENRLHHRTEGVLTEGIFSGKHTPSGSELNLSNTISQKLMLDSGIETTEKETISAKMQALSEIQKYAEIGKTTPLAMQAFVLGKALEEKPDCISLGKYQGSNAKECDFYTAFYESNKGSLSAQFKSASAFKAEMARLNSDEKLEEINGGVVGDCKCRSLCRAAGIPNSDVKLVGNEETRKNILLKTLPIDSIKSLPQEERLALFKKNNVFNVNTCRKTLSEIDKKIEKADADAENKSYSKKDHKQEIEAYNDCSSYVATSPEAMIHLLKRNALLGASLLTKNTDRDNFLKSKGLDETDFKEFKDDEENAHLFPNPNADDPQKDRMQKRQARVEQLFQSSALAEDAAKIYNKDAEIKGLADCNVLFPEHFKNGKADMGNEYIQEQIDKEKTKECNNKGVVDEKGEFHPNFKIRLGAAFLEGCKGAVKGIADAISKGDGMYALGYIMGRGARGACDLLTGGAKGLCTKIKTGEACLTGNSHKGVETTQNECHEGKKASAIVHSVCTTVEKEKAMTGAIRRAMANGSNNRTAAQDSSAYN